jgi:heme A synthase
MKGAAATIGALRIAEMAGAIVASLRAGHTSGSPPEVVVKHSLTAIDRDLGELARLLQLVDS